MSQVKTPARAAVPTLVSRLARIRLAALGGPLRLHYVM
jgi:hypothetical protein